MLGILGMKHCDFVELLFDRVLLDHLADEVVAELVRHHHVHVIRGHRTNAKLDIVPVLGDVAGQLRCIPLLPLLLLQMARILPSRLAEGAELFGLGLGNLCLSDLGEVG